MKFIATPAPAMQELDQVTAQIINRLTKYLIRKQIIVRDNDNEFQFEIPAEDTFSRLQASSVTYRFATGPSKGKKALILKSLNGRVPDSDHFVSYGLIAKNFGFSLHAGVATRAIVKSLSTFAATSRAPQSPKLGSQSMSGEATANDVFYPFENFDLTWINSIIPGIIAYHETGIAKIFGKHPERHFVSTTNLPWKKYLPK